MDAVLKALWLVPNLLLASYLAVAVLHRAVRAAGFPLAAAGLAAAVLNLPQGREILFVIAENAAKGAYRPALWGAAGLLLLSLVCWYAARRILYAPPDREPGPEAPEARSIRRWWPRLAAALPWLGSALALVRYPPHNDGWWWAMGLAAMSLLAAGAVTLLLSLRGRLLSERSFVPDEAEARMTWRWLIVGMVASVGVSAAIWLWVGGTGELLPIVSTYLGLLLVWLVPHQLHLRWSERQARRTGGDEAAQTLGPKVPWPALCVLAVVWALVTWLARPARPLAFATLDITGFGALAMFCLGLVSVVLFCSTLSFWIARDRRITGGAVALAILLWGMFLAGTGLSDNHGLWQGSSAPAAARKPVEQHLRKWLLDRTVAGGTGSRVDQPVPLVLVAAHGGGLRAAYWTAMTLAMLEQREPGFHCDLFAVAGISGGSVGALTWYANLPRPAAGPYRCSEAASDLAAKVDAGLAHDFLAALLGGLFGPDLPAHFVPGARAPDRQLYFESALTGADAAALAQDGRPFGFRELVRPDPEATEPPALFLIATDAGTGRRVIASDLQFDEHLLKNAVDLLALPEADRIGAVTAAAASARFPWVSPGGSLADGTSLLDGGVFEATGAEVVNELLRAVGGWCDRSGTPGVLRCTPGHGAPDRVTGAPGPSGLCVEEQRAQGNCTPDAPPIFVRPLALQLVNAPLVGAPGTRPILAAPELLGPIGALNAARGARGEAAWRTLEGDPSLFAGARDPEAPPFARFALDCERRPDSVTLSWTLSAERRAHMSAVATDALAGSTRADDVRLRAWLDRLAGRPAAIVGADDACGTGSATPSEAAAGHAWASP